MDLSVAAHAGDIFDVFDAAEPISGNRGVNAVPVRNASGYFQDIPGDRIRMGKIFFTEKVDGSFQFEMGNGRRIAEFFRRTVFVKKRNAHKRSKGEKYTAEKFLRIRHELRFDMAQIKVFKSKRRTVKR